MNWIQDEKKHLGYMIKMNARASLSNLGLLVFNIAGIYYNVRWGFLFSAGCFASNALWTFILLGWYFGELRSDKSTLRHIKKIEMESKLNEDREYYQKARKTYEDFFTRQDIVGSDTPTEPEKSGCGDSFVCTKADVQNCH